MIVHSSVVVRQDQPVLITVLRVLEESVVECETAIGPVTASWRGQDAPIVGMIVDAEMDVSGALVWGEDLSIVSSDGSGGQGQTLIGRVEDIQGESVTLRVAEGLLLLDVAGDPPLGALGEVVSITPECFEFWPTAI